MEQTIYINWYSGHMGLIVPNWFPTTKTKIRKLDKLQKKSESWIGGEEVKDFWGTIVQILEDTIDECKLSLGVATHSKNVFGNSEANNEVRHLQSRIKKLKENVAFIKEEFCNGT